MGIYSSKSSYYKLQQKSLYISHDKSYLNKFQIEFGLKRALFNPSHKKMKAKLKKIKPLLNWKIYLLTKFETSISNSWKNYLYNYIENEAFYNQYLFQNEMFYYEISILSMPDALFNIDQKNDSFKNKTILYPLDSEEMKDYSEMTKKKRKIESNLNNSKSQIIIENKNEISSSTENLNNTLTNESITTKKMKKDPVYENKYNSNQIKKYINFILNQLKNETNIHPITNIIQKFSNFYKDELKKHLQKDKENWENVKKNVINDLQYFIEIMQVALKLFYLKTINYKFFVCDRDEFINLVCYILFKIKKNNIYNLLFQLFQKSNEEKYEKLKEKIKNFGKLSPKDMGISPKFCLDEKPEEILKKVGEEKSKKKRKPSFVQYLRDKENKNENELLNINQEDDLEEEKGEIKIDKQILRTESFSFNPKNDTNNKRLGSISSYNEFAKSYNSKNEKERKESIIEDIDTPLSSIPTSDTKVESNKNSSSSAPYEEAIKYINTIHKYKGPLEKLTVMALTSIMITDRIDEFWKNEKNLPEKFLNIEADELMSIYLYIVYNMDISSILTQLDFIKYFTTPVTKQSMIGYYYTTVDGCIHFILDNENKEDFKNSAQ
jgi:hypothetical protein